MNIDYIVAVYALKDEDKPLLINILAQGYLQAKAQAYQKAQSRVGHIVRIREPWQVSDSDVTKAQQWASQQVESIAETYETLLRHALEELPEERAIGDIIGKAKQIVAAVGEWIKGFLPWKTQQIANQTWGTGANDGTNEWIDDAQDEDNTEGNPDNVRVRIEPSSSSSDVCSSFVGQEYSLSEFWDMNLSFPMHPNCVHSAEIVPTSGK